MEILLMACMLAYAAGAQGEQTKLGLSPADRAVRREQVRHEKAVRKLAEKHGTDASTPTSSVASMPMHPKPTLPEAFREGYRAHMAPGHGAVPLGHRAGSWSARGIAWASGTGKTALRKFRERRKAAGGDDPAPIIVPPLPPHPPTVGTEGSDTASTGGAAAAKAAGTPGGETVTEPVPARPDEHADATPAPEAPASEPAGEPAAKPEPAAGAAATQPDTDQAEGVTDATKPGTTVTEPVTATAKPETPTDTQGETTPTQPTEEAGGGGGGRMAAEVSYDSVEEESDELSLMCDDDMQVYERIEKRCEREISRGDELIAALYSVGITRIQFVARCIEQYKAIYGQLGQLKQNTVAQNEAVLKAKYHLQAGQGRYADIARDMEEVGEREFYTSDQVDSEDTSAHSETFETKGVA